MVYYGTVAYTILSISYGPYVSGPIATGTVQLVPRKHKDRFIHGVTTNVLF